MYYENFARVGLHIIRTIFRWYTVKTLMLREMYKVHVLAETKNVIILLNLNFYF